jgi:hypothetical protein
MPTLYTAEVKRTNRLGVGITGIHEFAYAQFDCTWYDLCTPTTKGDAFWAFISQLRQHIEDSADRYVDELNARAQQRYKDAGMLWLPTDALVYPHTVTTVKPSGTISKVMFCTEGGHLPAYGHYIRWVQYALGGAEALDLAQRGYPVKDVSASYPGHVVVGFPTELPIGKLLGQDLVVAGDATPDEQYNWLSLIERHWLGVRGNQCSYTLKFNPKKVPFEQFVQMVLKHQSKVRCCSVMAQDDDFSAYAYVPEERIDARTYAAMAERIHAQVAVEAYDDDALSCAGGACPIERDL